MGKRLAKADLIAEIHVEHENLSALIADLRPRQLTSRSVTESGWSVKDILGHLIGWHELNLSWHRLGMDGTVVSLPAPGFSWGQTRALNEQIYRRFSRRSLASVLQDFSVSHSRMMKLINGSSDLELVALNHFSWTGNRWTLSDYVRANTSSHYRWASKHIRKWKRHQKG